MTLTGQSSSAAGDANTRATPAADESLHELGRLAVPELGEWCVIDRLRPDGSLQRVAVVHADPARTELARRIERDLPAPSPEADRGIARVARTGETDVANAVDDELISRLARDPAHLAWIHAIGLRSFVSVALIARGHTLGVLSVCSSRPDQFTPDVVRRVEGFSRLCALALENADLYEAERTALAVAEAERARLRFLAEASATLGSSLEYRTTLQQAAHLAVPLFADYCTVDVVEDGRLRRVAVAHTDPAQEAELLRLAMDYPRDWEAQHPVGEVLRTGQRVLVTSMPEHIVAGMQRGDPNLAISRLTETTSYLILPLVARGQLLGTLAFMFTRASSRQYTADDMSLAEEIARRAASAIDNARLHTTAQHALERLDVIVSGIADGVTVQDASGHFVFANDPAAYMAGFDSADEYLNQSREAIFDRLELTDTNGNPFDYDQMPARRALRGEESPQTVFRFRRRDTGDVRWSMTRARAVRGPDGQPLAISIFHDLTDQVLIQRRLGFLADVSARLGTTLDEEETLRAIVEAAVESLADWSAVYLVDEDGQTIVRHTALHRDPGLVEVARRFDERYPSRAGPASVLWRCLHEGVTQFVPEVPPELLEAAAEDAEHLEMMRSLQLASCLYVPLLARGRTLGVLGLFTTRGSARLLGLEERAIAEEIARRAALAVDNARLYAAAREAIRVRDEFLSIASHELRNPVAAISGSAQLLLRTRARGALPEERLERHLHAIQRTAEHLAQLTDDLLDVARLQQGRMPLRPRELDLADFVQEVLARHQQADTLPRIHLSVQGRPGHVSADPDRLEQVLSNLFSNAVKYSPEGAAVDVTLTEAADGVVLSVRDHGIGLPPGTAERIFEPFGRAENASQLNIPGLGLGLYISRQIAERHGGRLWAESGGEGQGTTFSLWLPRATANET